MYNIFFYFNRFPNDTNNTCTNNLFKTHFMHHTISKTNISTSCQAPICMSFIRSFLRAKTRKNFL